MRSNNPYFLTYVELQKEYAVLNLPINNLNFNDIITEVNNRNRLIIFREYRLFRGDFNNYNKFLLLRHLNCL